MELSHNESEHITLPIGESLDWQGSGCQEPFINR